MLLHCLVIPVFLFPHIVVSVAPPAIDIVPENQALTGQTEDVHTDVNQMDIANMDSLPNPDTSSLGKRNPSLTTI